MVIMKVLSQARDRVTIGNRILAVILLTMTLILPLRAIAQDNGTPEAGDAESAPAVAAPAPTEVPIPTAIPTLPPPPVETQAPPVVSPTSPPAPVVPEPAQVEMVPTEAPVPPTEAPTQVPPTVVPTAVPTRVPPTAVPTALPTDVPPTVVPTPTPSPTPTQVSPTAVPTAPPLPVISYTVAAMPECSLATGQPRGVAHGQSIDYACTQSMTVSGSDVTPAAISATWDIRVDVGSGWSVSLLPPVNNPGVESPQWTTAGASSAFSFKQAHPLGSGAQQKSVDTSVTIGFRLRIQRAVCSEKAQPVQITHAVSLADVTPGSTVNRVPENTLPATVIPALQPIPQPSVTFDGPLDFGEVGANSSGPLQSSRSGSISLTVANLNAACGTWTLSVNASTLVNVDGQTLQGSQLMLVSVNSEPIPGDACDLEAGCDVVALQAGPTAASSQTVVLGVDLRMPEQPGHGSFGASLDAHLKPVPGR